MLKINIDFDRETKKIRRKNFNEKIKTRKLIIKKINEKKCFNRYR